MPGIGDYIHLSYENYKLEGTTTSQDTNNYNSAATILNQEKEKLLNVVRSRHKNNNYQALENVYNSIFYPKTSEDKNFAETKRQEIEKYLAEEALKWISLWDQGGNVAKQSIGKNSISVDRLLSLKNQIHNTILSLSNLDNMEEKVQQLQVLLSQLETLQNGQNSGKIIFTKNSKNLVADINKGLQNIATSTVYQALGNLFEKAGASLDDSLKNVTEAEAMRLVKENIVTSSKHSVHINANNATNNISMVGDLGDGIKFDIKGAKENSTSIYKADVQLTFNNERFNISAKNYKLNNNKNIHLLSSSPLLTILQNNVSVDYINHYLNIVSAGGKGRDKNLFQLAHNTTKIIIILEALTGISQVTGYADTLVINNRTAKKIVVKPMREIIDQLEVLYKDFKISGYRSGSSVNFNKKQGKGYDTNSAYKRISILLNKFAQDKISCSLNTEKLNWF